MNKHKKSKNMLDWVCNTPNPVAKNALKFNKAQVFRDQKNNYSRKAKHKNWVPSNNVLPKTLLEGTQTFLNFTQLNSASFC